MATSKSPKTEKVAKTAKPAKTAKASKADAVEVGVKTLSNIVPAHGSHTTNKRKGRGIGSGLGKTAGRGHKGQRARKSGNAPFGFEGGQMPLYRRLPKRGFKSMDPQCFQVVNLDSLVRLKGQTKITAEVLAKAGLIKHADRPVKILGRGTIEGAFQVSVQKVSVTARAAIVKAGGKVEEI